MSLENVSDARGRCSTSDGGNERCPAGKDGDDRSCLDGSRPCKHQHATPCNHRPNCRPNHPSEHDCLALISFLSRAIKLIHKAIPFYRHSNPRRAAKQQRGV